MSFITELRAKRQIFIDGLDANEGDINLGIFEDFYPDEAHFIYELLQNAEDAGATEVIFELDRNGCAFVHNGSRHFDEEDIKAITGIFSSSKKNNPDKIGKFGVGFKSVFVYTETPVVHSVNFSFRISELVLPEEIPPKKKLGKKTRFELPFNSQKKSAIDAYAEIKFGLDSLHEMTLLFLNNIKTISWKIGEDKEKKVSRLEHTEYHVELIRSDKGTEDSKSAHYLRFKRPVAELAKQYVSIAFQLEFLPTLPEKLFNRKAPLENQFRITPAIPGKVSVYFPAEKETSGLRFHLHAPFVPELSRASIKDTPANLPLYRQLAELAAGLLPKIRDLGLLKRELLAVLPNPQDTIPPRYEHIRASIIAAMNEEPLTPTHSGTHAPAKRLLQTNANFKDLFTAEDIKLIISPGRHDDWAIGASQKNNNQDRFLSGLAIDDYGVYELNDLLSDGMEKWGHTSNEAFENWLKIKPEKWHQQLYALLYREADCYFEIMRNYFLVRCAHGLYAKSGCCFFPADGKDYGDELTLVEESTYTSGNSKIQKEDSIHFLASIGVREASEAVYVECVLKQRYSKEKLRPDDKDLERFVALVEDIPSAASLFADYYIFQIRDGKWCKPSGIFLDKPFADTGLSAWYAKVSGRHALHEKYMNFSIKPDRLARFAEAVGAQAKLYIKKTSCLNNPDACNLYHSAPGTRTSYEHDEDYQIEGLKSVLNNPTLDVSKLIWRTLINTDIKWSKACYRRNSNYSLKTSPSWLAHTLKGIKWVPQGNEPEFVKPINASDTELPDGFPFDVGWPWLSDIEFGRNLASTRQNNLKQADSERRKLETAKSLGFRDEKSFQNAIKFADHSPEEQERILAEFDKKKSIDLPNHSPKNPGLRAERIIEQAKDAPERITERRMRSVAVGKTAITKEADEYIRHQYTNPDGVMICQVCQNELPFKLSDGSYYYEAVEFLQLNNRHPQNHLALCPNHAAMFKHANGSKDTLLPLVKNLDGNDLAIKLAGADAQIYFTTTHLADLKVVIDADASIALGSDGEQSSSSREDSGDDSEKLSPDEPGENSLILRTDERLSEAPSLRNDQNYPEMVNCPNCSARVRKDRLKKHILRVHSHEQNALPKASPVLTINKTIVPFGGAKANYKYDNCPVCKNLIKATQLSEHILKFHPEIDRRVLREKRR